VTSGGVTRGRLLQRAGSLGLNGGGATAAVPPIIKDRRLGNGDYDSKQLDIQEHRVKMSATA